VLNAATSGHLDITGNLDDESSYRSADPACHADGLRDC
jgi:hypothetical protein